MTTINVSFETRARLESFKRVPRETIEEVMMRLLDFCEKGENLKQLGIELKPFITEKFEIKNKKIKEQ